MVGEPPVDASDPTVFNVNASGADPWLVDAKISVIPDRMNAAGVGDSNANLVVVTVK